MAFSLLPIARMGLQVQIATQRIQWGCWGFELKYSCAENPLHSNSAAQTHGTFLCSMSLNNIDKIQVVKQFKSVFISKRIDICSYFSYFSLFLYLNFELIVSDSWPAFSCLYVQHTVICLFSLYTDVFSIYILRIVSITYNISLYHFGFVQ